MHSLKRLTFGIGKPLFEMCCVHMGIARFFLFFGGVGWILSRDQTTYYLVQFSSVVECLDGFEGQTQDC